MYGDVSTTSNVDTGAFAIGLEGVFVFIIILCILGIIINWKLFTKAGREGWKSLIPFYNLYIEFEIAGMNGWMFLLMLVPLVNYVMPFVLMYKLGKAFNKSTAFCIGLIFLSPIFLAILAFGSSEYALNAPDASISSGEFTGNTNVNNENNEALNADVNMVDNANNFITEPSIQEAPANTEVPASDAGVSENSQVPEQKVNIPNADDVFGANTSNASDTNNSGQNNMMN